jgi:hypothetical protein
MKWNVWRKATRSNPSGNCVEIYWKKPPRSNGSGGNNCVEVRTDGESILVRDTKDKGAGPILSFSPEAWQSFISGVKRGEFDRN